MSSLLVVGSLAYDSIKTPAGEVNQTLGGSANYFSLAASLFSKVKVVGVVGEDYRREDRAVLEERGVDLDGVQIKPGKTFHWKGQYEGDMSEAQTLATELNVFEHFSPDLPTTYKATPFVFLANIDPVLQIKVLDQIQSPKLVGSDTMNYWIQSKREDLEKVIKRIDVLLINEGEAKSLTQEKNAIGAAKKILTMGPKAVVVKRGEYGFVLYSSDGYFILPAFPVSTVKDPTGAGDSFAGAFFGYLAQENKGFDIPLLKRACLFGCMVASFTVEDFGIQRLKKVTVDEVKKRYDSFLKVIALD